MCFSFPGMRKLDAALTKQTLTSNIMSTCGPHPLLGGQSVLILCAAVISEQI